MSINHAITSWGLLQRALVYIPTNAFYPKAMPESVFSLPSFAKINLGLKVIGSRGDGFHDIFTVFQTVTLHDTISFSPSDELLLTCTDPSIPTDERNLIVRAARILIERLGVKSGADIHLEKLIPSSGGLGGGSSNAAVALIGLARLWKLEIEFQQLAEIGAEIGSDVPFFFLGGTAFGSGRGTDISPAPDFYSPFILIVTPKVAVKTVDAFKSLNASSLTKADTNRILQNCRLEAEFQDSYLQTMKNDFENVIFAQYPEIDSVKQRLLDLGASQAFLSGSGASVYGLFDIQETRQTAMKALDEQVNWRKFAVATISRNEYREALEIVY